MVTQEGAMRQVTCYGCSRWTTLEAGPDSAFWFLCWECLAGPGMDKGENYHLARALDTVPPWHESPKTEQWPGITDVTAP